MKLGVLGYPITHSKSPKIFEILSQKFSKNITYDIVNVSPEEFDFKNIISRYDGLNISYPYKERVIDFCDEINDFVSKTRSANTLSLKPIVKGFNTDIVGFARSLDFNSVDIKDKSILVCGGGAAARSILPVLCEGGAKKIQFKLRNIFKFEHACKHFITLYPDTEFSIQDGYSQYDIVINATSIGDGAPKQDFFRNMFKNTQVAIDLNYLEGSDFLKSATENNVEKNINGLSMLVFQAIAAYEIWFDRVSDHHNLAKEILEKIK